MVKISVLSVNTVVPSLARWCTSNSRASTHPEEHIDDRHGGFDPLGWLHRDVVVHDIIREVGPQYVGITVLAAAQKSLTTCSALGIGTPLST